MNHVELKMRIILFENNPHLRKKICSLVENTFHRSIDVMTDQWHELSESYREETTLYFLDIMVRDEAQGIAFAQWLLKKSNKHLIVFLTNYIDKILGQTYLQVNSFNVIYKGSPHVMEQIVDTIKLAQAHISKQTLVIENRIENYILSFDDIYSIQSIKKSNKVVIHTQRENHTCIASLKEIFSRLDKRFVYATRSSIINREKILKIDKVNKHFMLADGSVCDFTLSFALKGGLYDAPLLD